MLAYGSDTMPRLRQSFAASDFNIQRLLVDMVAISARHNIEKPTAPRKKT